MDRPVLLALALGNSQFSGNTEWTLSTSCRDWPVLYSAGIEPVGSRETLSGPSLLLAGTGLYYPVLVLSHRQVSGNIEWTLSTSCGDSPVLPCAGIEPQAGLGKH